MTIESVYKGSLLQYSPTREQVIRAFEDIVTKSVLRICQKHREMSQAAELTQYIKSDSDEAFIQLDPTDLKQMIYVNETFLVTQQRLK